MAGRLPHDKLSFAVRITGLTGLLGLCPLGLPHAEAATDPRIVGRYRQMVDANPVEGAALDRLWLDRAFYDRCAAAARAESTAEARDPARISARLLDILRRF